MGIPIFCKQATGKSNKPFFPGFRFTGYMAVKLSLFTNKRTESRALASGRALLRSDLLSPRNRKRRRILWEGWGTDLLLALSFPALGIGLFAPVMTFTKFRFIKNTVSISSGLADLFAHHEWFLFGIILLFSIIFPVAKLVIMVKARFSGGNATRNIRWALEWIGRLSKWSMLDVFAVALLVVTMKLGMVGKVRVRWGIYFFAAAVIFSTAAALWMQKGGGKTSPAD